MAKVESLSKREQHKKQTRQNLVNAGTSLFLAQGYEATTLEQVAERAGVHVQTLYRYFKNKESLALDLMSGIHAGVADILINDAGNENPLVKIENHFSSLLKYIDHFMEVDNFYELANGVRSLKAHNALLYRESEEQMAKALAEYQEDDSLVYSQEKAEAISSLIMSALWNAIQEWGESKGELSAAKAFKRSYTLVYKIAKL